MKKTTLFQHCKERCLKSLVSVVIFVSVVLLGGTIITLALPSSLDEIKSDKAGHQLTAGNWDYLVDKVSGIVNSILTVNNRINTLNDTVNTNNTNLTNRINSLSGTVNTNNTNLTNRINTLSGTVNTNNTNLTNRINTLSGTVNTNNTNLTNRINTLSGTVNTNNTNLTNRINTLSSTVNTNNTNLTNRINTLSGTVNTNNTNLTNRINTLSSTVNTNNTNLTNRINTLSSTIGNLSSSPQYMYVGLNSRNVGGASESYTVSDVDFCIINSVTYSTKGGYCAECSEYCYATPTTKTEWATPNGVETYGWETLGRTTRKLYVGGNDDDQIDCGFICIRL